MKVSACWHRLKRRAARLRTCQNSISTMSPSRWHCGAAARCLNPLIPISRMQWAGEPQTQDQVSGAVAAVDVAAEAAEGVAVVVGVDAAVDVEGAAANKLSHS